jgi:MOSC domain-containing protein YiiM
MPNLVSIAYTPFDVERSPRDHYARVSVEHAQLVAGHGIDGDAKATTGQRQLNVMLAETVDQLRAEGLHTAPGQLGEQLVVAGLNPVDLKPGVQLRLGNEAVIELGKLRTPCDRFAHIQGVPVKSAVGRIGYMARVTVGGQIAVGSLVGVDSGVSQGEGEAPAEP